MIQVLRKPLESKQPSPTVTIKNAVSNFFQLEIFQVLGF
jgi:hypothetical protein